MEGFYFLISSRLIASAFIITFATGLGGTIIGGLSYFRKFKRLSRKWFLGGLTASSICASIGVAAWVVFTDTILHPPRFFSWKDDPWGVGGFAEVIHEIFLQWSCFRLNEANQ
mgnify:FL=1